MKKEEFSLNILFRAFSQVKAMIQNVHNFRDECLKDETLHLSI